MERIVIDVEPDGQAATLAVKVGDVVGLRLPEAPTTGYRWQAEPVDSARLVDDAFDAAAGPRGGAGVRILTFEAVSEGRAVVRLAKRRAWGDTSPVAGASVVLVIGPADGR